MKLFFIFALLLFLINAGLLWYMSETGTVTEKKQNISFGIMCYHAVTGIMELLGLLSFGGAFLLMGIASVLIFIIFVRNQNPQRKIAKFAMKIIAVVVILELTIFNLPTWRTMFGCESRTFPASEADIESKDSSVDKNGDVISPDNQEIVLSYYDVNMPVRAVSAEVTFSDSRGVSTLIIDAKDETYQGQYRYDIGKDKIIAKRPLSNSITLDLSGNIKDIRVKFKSISEGTVTIHSVTLNPVIPTEVFYSRFLFLTLIPILIYAVMHTEFFAKSYQEKEKICRLLTLITAAVCCITSGWIMNYKLPEDSSWSKLIQTEEGNQVSKELVLAFEQGHVWLDAEPSQELLDLENPYDKFQRQKATKYEWDHVFYHGKYYSYYGIAPVILLFLPFHKITGYYCPTEIAVLLFSIAGFFGLACFFMQLIRKYFSGISSGIYLISMLMLFLNCGIWFSIGRPDFYEVAIASGFAFLTWGSYFLLSADLSEAEKISLPRICFASLFFAIAVLCRPTLVLYCICVGAYLLFSIKNIKKKNMISYLLCAFLPMISLGCVQMWYNYARFGSPFEFGIQYSLTINDFTHTEFHANLSWIAIYNYFFNAPVFSSAYPQIDTVFQDMQVNGFFYHDESTANTSGIFWLMPPLLAYLFSGKALKQISDKKTRIIILIMIPCVIIPTGIVASVWESGYTARYMPDFAWQMITGAYVIIFYIYLNLKDETKKQGIQKFLCGSFVWALIISGVQIFDFIFPYMKSHYDYPEMAYVIDKLFTFWR